MKSYINKLGEKVIISKMDVTYLLNAYKYFKRHLNALSNFLWSVAFSGCDLQGEQAQYDFDRGFNETLEYEDKLRKLVKSLKNEIIKRKLVNS